MTLNGLMKGICYRSEPSSGLTNYMKLIELGGKYGSVIGNYVMVDDEDYEYLNQWKWYVSNPRGDIYYAVTMVNRKLLKMHRILMNISDSKIQIDHVNRNGLDNQKSNLRIATRSQNNANRRAKKNGTSKYLGVSKLIVYNKYTYWQVQCVKGKKAYKKLCKTEAEAAVQYNEWAKELHGEFANLNIIKE